IVTPTRVDDIGQGAWHRIEAIESIACSTIPLLLEPTLFQCCMDSLGYIVLTLLPLLGLVLREVGQHISEGCVTVCRYWSVDTHCVILVGPGEASVQLGAYNAIHVSSDVCAVLGESMPD